MTGHVRNSDIDLPRPKAQKGWAPMAFALSMLNRSLGFRQTYFVENPAGGLACCNTTDKTIYINGDALEGEPVIVPPVISHEGDHQGIYNLGRLAPTVTAAFWHEVGHLLTPRIILDSPGNPRFVAASTALNEVIADVVGRRDMLRHAYSKAVGHGADEYGPIAASVGGDDFQRLLAHVTNVEFLPEAADTMEPEDLLFFATQHISRCGAETEISGELEMLLGEPALVELTAIVTDTKTFAEGVEDSMVSVEEFYALAERWNALVPKKEGLDLMNLRKLLGRSIIESAGSESKSKDAAVQDLFKDMEEQLAMEQPTWATPPFSGERAPSGEDWALRTKLREALVHLNYPDLSRTEGWEAAPPGRMSGVRAMQRDALTRIDPFLGDQVQPFRRVDRRVDPMLPVSVGVIIDQSGSMAHLSDTTTSLGWALAGAVRDIDGRAVVAGMADAGYVIEDSLTVSDQSMTKYAAQGSIENFASAWAAIGERMPLNRAPGVKMLVVATDWAIVHDSQQTFAMLALQDFRRRGGIVLSVSPNMPGINEFYDFAAVIDVTCVPETIADGILEVYQTIRTRKEQG